MPYVCAFDTVLCADSVDGQFVWRIV
jgi:N-terminal region of glycosyl transferase group 7/N-terminal domain of galactosyltransferase